MKGQLGLALHFDKHIRCPVLGLLAVTFISCVTVSGATVPLSNVVTSTQDGRMLIPLPQQLTWVDGDFKLNREVALVVANSGEQQDKQTISEVEQMLAQIGIYSKVVTAAEIPDIQGAIVIGEAGTNPWVSQLLKEMPVTQDTLPAEGYQLRVTPDYVLVAGVDALGTYWGVQTLRQLIATTEVIPVIRGVRLTDWPSFAVRGLHMYISSDVNYVQMPVVSQLMSRLKLNTLYLEVDQSKFASHPELWTSGAASREQMAQLAQAAHRQHIEVIPLVNLFGHMNWAFRGGNNLGFAADKANPIALNPTNPASYVFAQQILAEVIDLFQPRYVHIGHDEVGRQIPTGGKPFGQVFVDNITLLHHYLQERGIGAIIWADEAVKSDVYPYLQQLPKDLVMMFWDYGESLDYPQITQLRNLGFRVQAAAWYDWDNIQLLSRSARKQGAEGFLGTTWAGFFPDYYSYYQNLRQYVAYVLDAEAAWNTYGRNVNALPYDPGEVFRLNVAKDVSAPHSNGFSVDLSSVVNVNALNFLGKVTISRKIDGINASRAANTLIVYTPEHGRSTRCNKWGVEATVVNGRIVKLGGNDTPIPKNGMVLSGNGTGQAWLLAHAVMGAKVTVTGTTLTISTDEEARNYQEIARVLPTGESRLGGVRFGVLSPNENKSINAVALRSSNGEPGELPDSVAIPVNHKAQTLWFLHTANVSINTLTKTGSYKVAYTDGSTAETVLIYGLNLVAWNDIVNIDVRNRLALSENGRRICVFAWTNPYPEKTIASITFSSARAGTSPLLLAITGVEVE